MPAYVEALIDEAELLAQAAGQRLPVHTIFFGGGTPSLLPAKDVEKILDALSLAYSLSDSVEISLEANPGTLNLAKLQGFKAAGINRLSFGVQSASPEELRLLERQHDFEDVIQALAWARQAGFDNLNLDWIFGLPGQSLASWERNIKLAISLNPEHMSLYALSIEHGTPFKDLAARGLLEDIDPDLAADMYELGAQRLEEAGYTQYEISNWAKPGPNGEPLACRHNVQYWRNLPYAGLGAGAHGFLQGQRTANVLAPAAYIQRMKIGKVGPFPRTPATIGAEPVEPDREMAETMMMGLRLVESGVSRREFQQRFGKPLAEVYGPQVERLIDFGLMESVYGHQNSVRLTERGRLLGNQVFKEFV